MIQKYYNFRTNFHKRSFPPLSRAATFMGPLKLRLGIPQSSSESSIVSFDIPVVKVSSRNLTSDSDIGLERCDRWPLSPLPPSRLTRSLTPSVAVVDPGAGDSLALNLNKSRSSPWTTTRIRRRWIIDSREMRGRAVFYRHPRHQHHSNASPRLARYLGAWNRILIKAAEQKLRGSNWGVNDYSFRRVYWDTKTSYSYAIQRLLRTNRLFDCVSQSVCSQH